MTAPPASAPLPLPAAQDVIAHLEAAYPLPPDAYEAVRYLLRMKEIFEQLQAAAAIAAEETIGRIIDDGLTSSLYFLEPQMGVSSAIDMEKLRAGRPDVYERLVFVEASAGMRILSRRRIYELCREAAGAEGVRRYEKINKGELRKALPFDEVGTYITTWEEPAGYIIRERGQA